MRHDGYLSLLRRHSGWSCVPACSQCTGCSLGCHFRLRCCVLSRRLCVLACNWRPLVARWVTTSNSAFRTSSLWRRSESGHLNSVCFACADGVGLLWRVGEIPTTLLWRCVEWLWSLGYLNWVAGYGWVLQMLEFTICVRWHWPWAYVEKFSRVGRFIKREMCHEALFSAIVVLKNRFCTLVVCFRISESCDSHCRLSFCDTLVVDGASTRSARLWLFEL